MQVPQRVLGVLAGEDLPNSLLARWAGEANLVIAADRGADLCLRAGVVPNIVIGDMDSISNEARAKVPDVRVLEEQDTTDADKLLALAHSMALDSITLTAVEGDLPDHALAVLHSAARAPLHIRFAYRRGVGWIVRGPSERVVHTAEGRRISLLPLTDCTGVDLIGVRWPLADAKLHVHGLSSVSNRSDGPRVLARIGTGVALLFAEYPPDEVPFW